MQLIQISTSLPPHRYAQDEITSMIVARNGLSDSANKRLKQFHQSVRVESRHLFLPLEKYPEMESFEQASLAYKDLGYRLCLDMVKAALDKSGIQGTDLDAIFFTTVTGISVPTMDALLINGLRLNPAIERYPFFGLGCVAGVAGLSRMYDYLNNKPDAHAILVALEACSLTWQKSDGGVPNLIGSGLFGDGAACVIASSKHNDSGPRVLDRTSHFFYDQEEVMGWKVTDTGFGLVLNAEVPTIVRQHLKTLVKAFLDKNNLDQSAIHHWICHPGGPKVLEAIQETLGLNDEQVQVTWDSLRDTGNLSSASVLHILQNTINSRTPKSGEFGLMIAMGPGFTAEMVLLQW